MKRAAKWLASSLTAAAGLAAMAGSLPAQAATRPQQQLVLYSAQGYDAAMAQAFQKATGIHVTLVDNSTGTIIAKIEAERSNPHWDVVWFDGDSTMQALDNQGMLLRNWTPADVKNYTPLGRSLIARDKSYYPGGVTAAAAIAFNPKVLPPSQAPHTLQALLSPKLRGMVAMNDPSISGPTYPFVAGVMQQMGMKKGQQYFTALKANGLHVYRTNSVTLGALLAGRAEVILIQDSALISAKQQGSPIDIVYPKSGAYTLPDVLGINKQAPDMAAAKRFVQFVLSKQGQRVMLNPNNGGGDSYFNPVIKGMVPNKARQQSGIHWVRVNPIWAAHVENPLKTWFHDHVTA